MTTIVACPACQQSLQLPPEMMDREVRCPGCQQVFKAASSAVRAAPPPPMPEAVPEWEKPRGDEELEKPLDEDEAQELEEEAREAERRRRGRSSGSSSSALRGGFSHTGGLAGAGLALTAAALPAGWARKVCLHSGHCTVLPK